VRKTINLVGTCAARSQLTLTTERISRPYEIARILATYPTGCLNLLSLRFFLSWDDSAPTTGYPRGTNLLAENSSHDALIGEGQQKAIEHHVRVETVGSYLKVHATNDDWYDHAVDVQITIDTIDDIGGPPHA